MIIANNIESEINHHNWLLEIITNYMQTDGKLFVFLLTHIFLNKKLVVNNFNNTNREYNENICNRKIFHVFQIFKS